MKKYFNVSFQYSESVYCANIAHAESAEAVEAHYSAKYEWCKVSEATAADVEEAQRKGKPIIEIETPAAEAEPVTAEAEPDAVRQAALIHVLRDRRDWYRKELARALDKVKDYEAAARKAQQEAQKADEARALAQGELEDAREALADMEAERDDLAQSVENALQHAEEVEEKAQKLAAEVLRLKAQLFDMMEAQQGWTV